MLSVFFSGIYWTIKIILLLIIVGDGFKNAHRYLSPFQHSGISKVMLRDNNCIDIQKTGLEEWLSYEIENSTVWSWLVILRLKALFPGARAVSLLVARDSVSKEAFRHVCRWANQTVSRAVQQH